MCHNWFTEDQDTRRVPVGIRRDDITNIQRAQIAIQVLSPQYGWGTVTGLAEEYEISRQTVYKIAEAGKRILMTGLKPMPHGPQPTEKVVKVDRNRLVRGVVTLTEAGVSQRDIALCLAALLDTAL